MTLLRTSHRRRESGRWPFEAWPWVRRGPPHPLGCGVASGCHVVRGTANRGLIGGYVTSRCALIAARSCATSTLLPCKGIEAATNSSGRIR